MDNTLLVKSIKNICEKNNTTVSQLESALGFSSALISRWNKTSPSLDKIIEIAKYFHISLDEVVGYNNGIDDEFILALTDRTNSQDIIWNNYNEEDGDLPKQYHGESPSPDDFIDKSDFMYYVSSIREQCFYSKFKRGYIIIWSLYLEQNITEPNEIALFIQPNCESNLIRQKYNSKQLLNLWLRILYNLGDSSPDEIQAEILKRDFIQYEPQIFLKEEVLKDLLLMRGCCLYDIRTDTLMDNDLIEISEPMIDKAILYYNNNKDSLGSIEQIKMCYGQILFLKSSSTVMKLDVASRKEPLSEYAIKEIQSLLSKLGVIKPFDYFTKNTNFEVTI